MPTSLPMAHPQPRGPPVPLSRPLGLGSDLVAAGTAREVERTEKRTHGRPPSSSPKVLTASRADTGLRVVNTTRAPFSGQLVSGVTRSALTVNGAGTPFRQARRICILGFR
jgi:hypothetical protein